MPGHCQHGELSSLFARASRSLSAVFLARSQDESVSCSLVRPDSGARLSTLANGVIAPGRRRWLSGQGPGQRDKSADTGASPAGADVAIWRAIVESRTRNVQVCPGRALRDEFA
jgi:hypothetical protein